MDTKFFKGRKEYNVSNRDCMFSVPNDEEYEKIKPYLNGEVPKDELFVYPIMLCDNNIDRDNDRFTHEDLVVMEDKYKGVIGINDHNHKTGVPHSVTYDTELVVDETELNSLGEPYEYLIGYQYTLNNEKNKSLIDDIKAGIKQGASIGFLYKTCKCSICGNNYKDSKCEHTKGKTYNGKLCIGTIGDITDALEWSFVVVPSQRNAGLIKEFNTEKEDTQMDIKEVIKKACTNLSDEESALMTKAFEGVSNDEAKDKEIEALKLKLKAFEDENNELKEKMANTAMEGAKSKVYEGLTPINEKAKDLADTAIEGLLSMGEDGEVSGIDEAKELLHTDYNFLFTSDEPDGDEGAEEIVEDALEGEKEADMENKEDEVGTKSFKGTAQFSMGAKAAVKSVVKKPYVSGVREKL